MWMIKDGLGARQAELEKTEDVRDEARDVSNGENSNRKRVLRLEQDWSGIVLRGGKSGGRIY